MSDLNWMHFTAPQTRRKRAELVCVVCHSKKIKCDLQNRSSQGHSSCTNCNTQDRDCRVRAAKRDKRARRTTKTAEPLVASAAAQTLVGIRDSHPLNQQIEIPESSHRASSAAAYSNLRARTDPSPPTISNVRAGSPQESIRQQRQSQDLPSIPARQTTFPEPPGSQTSNAETGEAHTGDVDTGFLQIYDLEHQHEAETHALVSILEYKSAPELLEPDLQQSFIETYFEYCYPFCPILDRKTIASELARSPLLTNALAVAGSHVQPPLIPHDGPVEYYKRARTLFYNDEETDGMASLKAIALFYWWAPVGTTIVHRHSSWWWTSVLIRHAQQMNFHRASSLHLSRRNSQDCSLRRRIWWTAFARERLTALCQSKPCIIDPDDCNIEEPTLADFPDNPEEQRKGEIFIYWVQLCAIIGRIAKVLSRSSADSTLSPVVPFHLLQELIDWVHSLPPHLQLPIGSARTEDFNRNVHQLHLPYLTVITILHLKRSAFSLPQALPPAILAASCIARILRDILSRGSTRFLMAITCWYTGTAFIALLQACHVEHLSKDANQDIDVLENAVKQLQTMWASANILVGGFDRLRRPSSSGTALAISGLKSGMPMNGHPLVYNNGNFSSTSAPATLPAQVNKLGLGNIPEEVDFDWMAFFPFVTSSTNGIAEKLLSERANGSTTRGFPSPSNELFHENIMMQYQDLFDPLYQDDSWAPGSEFGV